MNNKKTKTVMGDLAREVLMKGIDQVHGPVAATIGAQGRNAVYEDWGAMVTNDGVSIARKINPEDPFERLGADIVKQAAEKTNEEAGDGTTTTIVLTKAIIDKGFEAIKAGTNPMAIFSGLEKAKVRAIEILKGLSRDADSLFNVANISVQDETIAKIVSDAVTKAGKNGNVVVEESNGFEIEKEEVQGYFYNRGYVSPYMVTDPEKMEAVLNDCAVVITDRLMNLNRDLVGVLEDINKSGTKSALIICDKVEGELLQTLIVNKMKGIFTAVVVRRPNSVEELEDLAAMTNSIAVTEDKGFKEIKWTHVGRAKRIVAKRNEVVIIGEDNDRVKERISNLEQETVDKPNDELLKARLAKLANGVVVLKVGAKTEAERRYLKLKVDDAVGACKAALQEGIVEGGGVALYKVAEELNDGILSEALKQPYLKILQNADIKSFSTGLVRYNVLTGEQVEDMFAVGIVDPTKVERCSIENAVSSARSLLTIESATVDIPEEVKPVV